MSKILKNLNNLVIVAREGEKYNYIPHDLRLTKITIKTCQWEDENLENLIYLTDDANKQKVDINSFSSKDPNGVFIENKNLLFNKKYVICLNKKIAKELHKYNVNYDNGRDVLLSFQIINYHSMSFYETKKDFSKMVVYRKILKKDISQLMYSKTYRYTFSDRESLLIRCEKVNRKNKLIKDSHFMGYEWMVDSILKNGCIKS